MGLLPGARVHGHVVEAIAAAAGEVPVQVGGGVRTAESIERYLDAGVSQVIVGTRAIEDPPFLAAMAERFPRRVILGLDARAGRAATAGWDETSETGAVEFAASVRGPAALRHRVHGRRARRHAQRRECRGDRRRGRRRAGCP